MGRSVGARAGWALGGVRRRLALAVAVVLLGTGLQAVSEGPASAADPSTSRPKLPAAEKALAGHNGKVLPRRRSAGPRVPQRAPKAAWPEPGTATVSVPERRRTKAGEAARSSGAKAGDLPLTVLAPRNERGRRKASASVLPAVDKVTVAVLDRDASSRAGAAGPLVTLERADGVDKAGGVGVEVDYRGFAEAFGGAYGSRLRLVQLPVCALVTPDKPRCRRATPVASSNDSEDKAVSAPSLRLGASGPTVLALTAAPESSQGDYKATSLSPSATWQTSLNTGAFAWSYDMPVPQVPGGLVPNVGLSYSSDGIDGRTSTTNNQGGWVGDGFQLWPGFIERRYKPCKDDGAPKTDGQDPADLCWGYDNATISFNGKAGELIPAGKGVWKLKDDDGTRIERLDSSSRGNGDKEGEYWRVTTTDGTRYYFGYNRLPGWASGDEATDSTWNTPVYGNDAGEPCHAATFADSWCQRAWRWNLDYVVDPHGNAVAYYYTKEGNSYGRDLKATDDTPYTRGGHLDRIEYGLRSSSMYDTKPLARVDFSTAERCLPQTGVTCAADTIDDKARYWYDTPWDLNCKSGTKCDKGRYAPTFWSRKRLTSVTTEVRQADGTYADVDTWKLGHRWGMADIDYQLLLDSIQHTGESASPAITLPKTTFVYTQAPNRLDLPNDDTAPFIMSRLSTVDDESGGQIDVNYSSAACDAGNLPKPESNSTRCYPVYMEASGDPHPTLQWFNKYVVDSVTTTDRTGGAAGGTTQYSYLDGGAWHYDDDDGLTKEKYKTWSTWRGYGHVRVSTGSLIKKMTQEDHYFLRGMDGDKAAADGGSKDVTVDDGEGTKLTDHDSLGGFEYRSEQYSAPGGKVLAKTVNHPWHHRTAERIRSWGTATANLTGAASARAFTSLDDGAGSRWRQTLVKTDFEDTAGRAVEVDDLGDTASSSDSQCTRTTYVDNAADWVLDSPARVETVAKSCDDTSVDRSKDVLSDVRTAYDKQDYGAAPTDGDVTRTATLKSHDGTKATYLESGATYDSYGRALTGTDLTATVTVDGSAAPVRTPRTDGRTTTTAYTPATGLPTTVGVTDPPAKAGDASTAWTSTTTLDPVRGQPTSKTDPNTKRTDLTYDALGRSAEVWLPNRSKANGERPNYEFTYTVAEGDAVAVGTKSLTNTGTQKTSYTLYDGFLRERQTQAPGPEGGRLISDNFYDERGLTAKTFAPYYAEHTPSATLFSLDDAVDVETQTWFTYDGLGRPTQQKQVAGNSDAGKVLSVTRTDYDGDRVTVTPPDGGTTTTTLSDARGRATELWQYHGAGPTGPADKTVYDYTPAGQLAKVTDPAGNSWSYTYDQLGRQTAAKDPDKGRTTSTYDDRGQLTSTTDAGGKKLVDLYDGLGRKTELRNGSATGTLRARWTYDTVFGAKGLLASSTRYDGGNAYTTAVNAYDGLNRVTRSTTTIPDDEGALAGSYQTNTRYNLDGTVQSTGYPAAGSLPGEPLVHTYDDTKRPIRLSGESTYVTSTSYSYTGKPLQYELAAGGKRTWVTNTFQWGTQRLANSRVDREDVPGVDKSSSFAYDDIGNILSLSDVSREGTDTQCFTYDHQRRLTEAWTQSTTSCDGQPTKPAIGGPAPYWQSFTYDVVGNRLAQTRHDPSGDSAKDIKQTYTYPAAGSPQPHTLSKVDTVGPNGSTAQDSYTYDAVGNTATRTIGGDKQSLTWDEEGHLATLTERDPDNTTRTTSYLYDADGNRLIQRTDQATTLYLSGQEISQAKGSSKAKATRYYDLGGAQAIRTDDNKLSFVVTDHNGTGELAVDSATQALKQRRSTPFGAPRGATPSGWPGHKGFIGGTQDTTGLTHLGAREYDPSMGRFVSVDPVMDLSDPQQINGYTYGNNNPLSFSDPSGMMFPECSGSWVCKDGTKPVEQTGNNVQNKSDQAVYHSNYVQWQKGRPAYSSAVLFRLTNTLTIGEANEARRRKDLASGVQGPITTIVRTLAHIFNPIASGRDCSHGDVLGCAALVPWAKPLKLVREAKFLRKASDEAEDVAKACRNSFVAGVKVLAADGAKKPIEELRTGDKVLATDPKTGKTQERTVVATIVTDDDKSFVKLTVAHAGKNASIVTTRHHPFWSVSRHKWVDAGDLAPGTTLRTDKGATAVVRRVGGLDTHRRTYNLTVAELHTYYVLAGQTPVLVHNSNCDLPEGYTSSPALKGDPYHPDTVAERSRQSRELYAGTMADRAGALGYRTRIPAQRAPFNSHGQVVFSNGKNYITPDVDGHNVTDGWKMFNRRGQRIGTYDQDLNYLKE
ncbi:polymorphic toxin-type HINT domain-containing protein [Wenjunlia tyrosinilytica]|nr:polymorphic toxin-type HINT domain-containing protein [Wenjunlia tyrosinilytica]